MLMSPTAFIACFEHSVFSHSSDGLEGADEGNPHVYSTDYRTIRDLPSLHAGAEARQVVGGRILDEGKARPYDLRSAEGSLRVKRR